MFKEHFCYFDSIESLFYSHLWSAEAVFLLLLLISICAPTRPFESLEPCSLQILPLLRTSYRVLCCAAAALWAGVWSSVEDGCLKATRKWPASFFCQSGRRKRKKPDDSCGERWGRCWGVRNCCVKRRKSLKVELSKDCEMRIESCVDSSVMTSFKFKWQFIHFLLDFLKPLSF